MFARVDIGVTEFPTKTAKKYEIKKFSLSFFFQKWACASRFQWPMGEFAFYFAAEKLTFWDGGITSKLASQ